MTKIYIQKITGCWECPDFYPGGDYPSECCRTNKIIDDNSVIQSWYPLPNVEGE